MKTESTTPHPNTEFLTPLGPYRLYFNHSTVDREGTTIHIADYVEADTESKDDFIVSMVRLRYSINDEIAIQRKLAAGIDTDNEFDIHNKYVEECKAIVKSLL